MIKKAKADKKIAISSVVASTITVVVFSGLSFLLSTANYVEDNSMTEEEMVEEYGICERERYVGSRTLNNWLERGYTLKEEESGVAGRSRLVRKVPCNKYGQPIAVESGEYD